MDVYSATMVLYTMFLGEVPFKNMDGMAFAEHSARQAERFSPLTFCSKLFLRQTLNPKHQTQNPKP